MEPAFRSHRGCILIRFANDGVAFALDITDRKRLERQFRGPGRCSGQQIGAATSVEEVLRVAS